MLLKELNPKLASQPEKLKALLDLKMEELKLILKETFFDF
jgi:hypothetical protein